MANQIDSYVHIKYAQELYQHLQKNLGMANTIHRGYTKTSNERGKTIQIDRPSDLEVATTPGATPQNLDTGKIDITLDVYRKVEFGIQDNELSYASDRIMTDHIPRAAYKLAEEIDAQLNALGLLVPWYSVATASPTDVSDITALRRALADRDVPMRDPNRFLELSPEREEKFLNLQSFHTANMGAGGVQTQVEGLLGRKFGFDIFPNQNVTTFGGGTLSTTTLAVLADTAKGATTIGLDAVSVTGTLKKGSTFSIAGHTQRYAVTGDVAASSNAFANVGISPALASDVAENAVVTVRQTASELSLAYHRSFAALAFSPLPNVGEGEGARTAVIADPITQLAIRMGSYYNGSEKKRFMWFDVLFGTKVLDPNRAQRYEVE